MCCLLLVPGVSDVIEGGVQPARLSVSAAGTASAATPAASASAAEHSGSLAAAATPAATRTV